MKPFSASKKQKIGFPLDDNGRCNLRQGFMRSSLKAAHYIHCTEESTDSPLPRKGYMRYKEQRERLHGVMGIGVW